MTNSPAPHAALQRIEKVDARLIWRNEATEFTPWLYEHIGELNEALGFEIELTGREETVGAFAVDLYGKELQTARPAIIENQLEVTDHGHLGQLMTYAAGLKAGVVVWIAPHFRPEHREALVWLNEVSNEDISFFGVELEVLDIGGQRAAHFNVVAQPDTWRKTVLASGRPSAEPSSRRLAYQAYFESLLADLKTNLPDSTTATKVQPDSWFAFSSGRGGVNFMWSFTGDGRFRTELYIDVGDADRNAAILDRLQSDSEIRQFDFGVPLEFEPLEARRAKRIAVYAPFPARITDSEQTLTELRTWALATMVSFVRLFRPKLRAMII